MLIETDNYIDAVTASKILGITRARVSTLCKEGRFAGMVRVGHFWLIPREAVENFKRLPPGVKSKTKQQQKEDKALIAEALEATNSAPNENIARSEER